MRKFGFLCLWLLILGSTVFGEMLAIREDGRNIKLNSDYTWELVQLPKIKSNTIPSEPQLFKYAIEGELYQHYLDNYEGIDLKNTIAVYYNLAFSEYRNFSSDETELKRLLVKGIQYTLEYGKIFVMPLRIMTGDLSYNQNVSNLMFFWQYAEILEEEGRNEEALTFYQQLKDLHVRTGEQYTFGILYGEQSLEKIESKIYKINYLLESI